MPPATSFTFHNLTCTRTVLANGLEVILAPMDQKVFCGQMWYHVGSRHEQPHRTGLAHLFEHLMFKATRNFPNGSFDKEMEKRGASTNAATWVDWTYYTASLPCKGDNLATLLHFEADRMQHLLLDAATFASELEVVKNERRLSVEDSVPGQAAEALYALAFTQHPYRWPTIGSMAHLQAATLADLRAFYTSYYAPNNATLVLCGGLDPDATLGVIWQEFAGIPMQEVPAAVHPPEPPQTAPRRRELQLPSLTAHLSLGFKAPPQAAANFPAHEMMGDVLTSGEASRLYQKLVVEEALASDISGNLTPFVDPGLFELHAQVAPGVEPQELEDAIWQQLRLLQTHGPQAHELSKAKLGCELALLDEIHQVEGCAESLGHFAVTQKDFAAGFKSLSLTQALTHIDVQNAAQETLRPELCSTVVVRPK